MTTIPRDCTSLQAERTARAAAMAGKYGVEMVQPGMWVCVHPDEYERSYVVTLTGNGAECSCPDFVCTTRKQNVSCKHIEMMRILFPDELWLKRLAAPKGNPYPTEWELKPLPEDIDIFA